MSTNYLEKIEKTRKTLEQLKQLRIKAEGQLEELVKHQKKIFDEIQQEGISPDSLEDEIKNLENEIDILLESANNTIPHDLIEELARNRK